MGLDFSQAPAGLVPAAVVDHVLLPVADLEEGVWRLQEEFGLEVVAGGQHPGWGTANSIVPLGRQYLELITVENADQAAASDLGRAVTTAIEGGRTFVSWAVRTADLGALRAKLRAAGLMLPDVTEGTRPRPDGPALRWRTQDLADIEALGPLPFAIEWDIPEGAYPGRAVASPPAWLQRVVVGARDPARVRVELARLLGDSSLVDVRDAAEDGVQQVVLGTANGELVVE